MKNPEQIYALFVEANPVVDADLFYEQLHAEPPELQVVEETTEWTASPFRPAVVRKRRRIAAAAAAATLLVVGIGALLWRTGDATGPVAAEAAAMRVVFDGAECTYEGPAVLSPGTGSVQIERAAEAEPVAVLVTPLRRDVTFAEIEEWVDGRSAREVPAFIWGERWNIVIVEGAEPEWLEVSFVPGRYVVTCNTAPEGSDRVFPARIIEVVDGSR